MTSCPAKSVGETADCLMRLHGRMAAWEAVRLGFASPRYSPERSYWTAVLAELRERGMLLETQGRADA